MELENIATSDTGTGLEVFGGCCSKVENMRLHSIRSRVLLFPDQTMRVTYQVYRCRECWKFRREQSVVDLMVNGNSKFTCELCDVILAEDGSWEKKAKRLSRRLGVRIPTNSLYDACQLRLVELAGG
jgi:hypothetical protein